MTKKILIVDDDVVVVHLVESILVSNGYEVVKADDGISAMVKLKEEDPDLVILDIVLPEINGYDICHHLRFNKDYEKIPIVILSERNREIGEVIEAQTNIEYLQKPVDSQLLLEKIEKLLT